MRVKVKEMSMYDLDGSIRDVIQRLSDLQKEYPNEELMIDHYMDTEPYSYSDKEYLTIEVYYNSKKKKKKK